MDLRKVYIVLFFFGLFFLPFNSIEGYKILSIFKKEASAYFWIPTLLLIGFSFLFAKKKIVLPTLTRSYQLFFVFLAFSFLTLVFNLEEIMQQFYKQKSGLYMFAFNFFTLVFAGVGIVTLVFNVFKGMTTTRIFVITRKVIFWSFLFVFGYGILQMFILRFQMIGLEQLYYSLDYLPFVNGHLFYNSVRLNSVSYEVPALGTYLIFVHGWMFSYILTHQSKWRFVPFAMVLFLVYFSGARSALISIVPQLIVILLLFKPSRIVVKKNVVFAVQLAGVLLLLLVALKGNTLLDRFKQTSVEQLVGTSISNKSRIGMQVASLKVFLDSPIYGVGLGQETYSKIKYYPTWAVKDNFEFSSMYLNEQDRMYPPAFNIYTKLLAETGIIGFFLFVCFLWWCIKENYTIIIRSSGTNRIFAQTLLITLVGLIVNWGQNDDYMLYSFWISYAFVLILMSNKIQNERDENFGRSALL
ncbi:O-antigen ligase family protein [Myroides sp. DF42-4-2]|uniref:O-antigen ligase family protein n=1 Tax=unclassified Myroides TaxID=2642485 RepID=UPI002577176F|nr:O-antigen ligase family protein [Myroides sp. DF42-4-2]MDM1406871.1 O-antigen ligase family protein [Myroides sp. DF42-4-2]